MDYELEVFEVYDDSDQPSNKKHLKHTRKKCKHKGSIVNLDSADNDIHRSKSSVVSGDCPQRRPLSLRQSILSFFTKLVVWRDQRRYQATVPDKADSPHSSKDFRRGFVPCGELYTLKVINTSTVYKKVCLHSSHHPLKSIIITSV